MKNKPFNIYGKLQSLAEHHTDGEGVFLTAKVAELDNEVKQHNVELLNLSADIDALILKDTKNVYVSPSGNDETGEGTESKPWKTIQKAVDKCPNTSDGTMQYTINIADGTYDEKVLVWNKKGLINLIGSNSANGVVIKNGIQIVNTDYIVFQKNLTIGFSGVSNDVIFVSNSHLYFARSANVIVNGNTSMVALLAQEHASVVCGRAISGFTINNCARGFRIMTNANLYLGKCTINCNSGISAEDGGRVTYNSNDVVNNATTKLATSYGGRIYADSQTSMGQY